MAPRDSAHSHGDPIGLSSPHERPWSEGHVFAMACIPSCRSSSGQRCLRDDPGSDGAISPGLCSRPTSRRSCELARLWLARAPGSFPRQAGACRVPGRARDGRRGGLLGEAEVAGDPDAIYTYDPALAAMADGIRRVFMAHVTRYAENAPFVHEVADAFAAIQAGDVQWVRRPTTTPASPSGPAGSVASASSPGPAPFEPQWLQRGTCEGQPHE